MMAKMKMIVKTGKIIRFRDPAPAARMNM